MKTFIKIIFLFTLTACNPFAPSLSDQSAQTNAILTEQLSPQEVMTNFSYAYNFKDSLVYSDLLDSTFLFIYTNYSTTPVTKDTWDRDTDLRTTSALFRVFETLNLIWGGTIFLNYLDEDSSTAEIKQVFQLTLTGGSDIYTLNGEALFILNQKKSGIWKITRWEDLAAD